jgi:hypothetical protein
MSGFQGNDNEGIKEIINNSKNESEDDRAIYCTLFLFVHNE